MRACPFCGSEMQEAFTDGLSRETCKACGAVWIEGKELEKLVGHIAADALLRNAKGKPGECKDCHEPLQYVPNCPRCGRASPACPECHSAPLPVTGIHGVKVDVCTQCQSVGLDAHEMEQLQAEMRRERFLNLDLRAHPMPAPDGRPPAMVCATCSRKLKPQYAFSWETHFYCGSCAPTGAAPFDMELTKAGPSELRSVRGHTVGGYTVVGQNIGRDPLSEGLAWLFTKLFR